MTDEGRQYEGDVADQRLQENMAEAPPLPSPATLVHTAQAYIDSQQQAAQYQENQGQRLAHGQEMRGEHPHPDADYDGFDHERLYAFSQENNSAAEIDERGRAANDLGNFLQNVADAAKEAMAAEGTAWQGAAAEQAGSWVNNTTAWMKESGDGAHLISNQYSSQTEIASRLKNETPPPTGFNAETELAKVRNQVTDGDIVGAAVSYSQISAKEAEARAKRQEAIDALRRSDEGYVQTAMRQPAFTEPPSLTGDQAGGSTFASSTGGAVATGVPAVGSAGGMGGAPGGSGPVAGGSTGAPPVQSPGATTGVGGTGGGPAGGPAGSGAGVGPRPGAGGGFAPLAAGAARTGETRRSNPSPFRGGKGAGGTAKPGQNRAGGRVSGPPAAKGPGAAGRVAAGPGSGDKAGAGQGKSTGAQPPKQSAIGGRAAAAHAGATGPRGGMPIAATGAGGRGAQGDDDKDKKASDLLKNEDLFTHEGEDGYLYDAEGVVVPPEVIGETDQAR